MDFQARHAASCHCGAVRLELHLPKGDPDLRRCNCSMCRRRGAIMLSVPLKGLKVAAGKDILSEYQFNTLTARHYFCSRCGIYTHHQRRSNPNEYGVNVGCLEGMDPNSLVDIPLMDGVNHPSDQQEADR